MSALMAERHDLGRQESLFEGLASPRPNPWARPPDVRQSPPTADAVSADANHELAVDVPAEVVVDPSDEAELAGGAQALHGETVHPPEAFGGDITIERRPAPVRELAPRRGDAETLAGPTLDDVVSRMWEGLATGLPAACPLCHGEVVPTLGGSLSGSCASCGTTID